MAYYHYRNLLTQPLRNFFATIDPEGLIAQGAPRDEYDSEADRIAAYILLQKPHDVSDLLGIVWPIFKHWLGYYDSTEREHTAHKRYAEISAKLFDYLEIHMEKREFTNKHRLNRRTCHCGLVNLKTRLSATAEGETHTVEGCGYIQASNEQLAKEAADWDSGKLDPKDFEDAPDAVPAPRRRRP